MSYHLVINHCLIAKQTNHKLIILNNSLQMLKVCLKRQRFVNKLMNSKLIAPLLKISQSPHSMLMLIFLLDHFLGQRILLVRLYNSTKVIPIR
ncbi:MAG: hypothetical protein DI589_18900 [Shinella sp.]|nr:MAG: hypothetical protein DI589_18900 [Shinella sp.]